MINIGSNHKNSNIQKFIEFYKITERIQKDAKWQQNLCCTIIEKLNEMMTQEKVPHLFDGFGLLNQIRAM
jgi:hypothetical protein